jgi:hypothetical protein
VSTLAVSGYFKDTWGAEGVHNWRMALRKIRPVSFNWVFMFIELISDNNLRSESIHS